METEYFRGDRSVETIPALEVVDWMRGKRSTRLFLPPIQRSAVWSNAQIVNYWDSLLRGYPAGLMMVHRSAQTKEGSVARGRTPEGLTSETLPQDYHLFDGQQRMTAILLGHNTGHLEKRLKLWIDLGVEASEDSELLFQLRISSTGQPFGYKAEFPNEKPQLGKRRSAIQQWLNYKSHTTFDPLKAFDSLKGEDLIGSSCSVPLPEIISDLSDKEEDRVIGDLKGRYPTLPLDRLRDFVRALNKALQTPIVFQLIDQCLVEDEREYIRFFGRLGQGGTALTNDELTYSIIKYQYPEVHDRMSEITNGRAGRIASEVNLVLAALRVAKAQCPWEGAQDWEIVNRPYPGFVSRLKELKEVESRFQAMIPLTESGLLKNRLESIRGRLVYDESTNEGGLPKMLLARLPHQLVDVLLLLESGLEDGKIETPAFNLFPPFVLFWLLFVSNPDRAASMAFRRYTAEGKIGDHHSIRFLIQKFVTEGVAYALPSKEQLPRLRLDIEEGSQRLLEWNERFTRLDEKSERRCGDALRRLSTNNELIKRALMWVQRKYLATEFQNFDPTSNRDEDLPIDLDHLIPQIRFGFDWRSQNSHLQIADAEKNFRWGRGVIGNSLGNYRWLGISSNRGRQDGEIEGLYGNGDFISEVSRWNDLINRKPWVISDVTEFQRIIDLRTIGLYEELLTAGRLDLLGATEPELELSTTN